jgi:hypothetical protein
VARYYGRRLDLAGRRIQNSEVPQESATSRSATYRELVAGHQWTVDMKDVLSFNVGMYIATLSAVADAFAAQLEQGMC